MIWGKHLIHIYVISMGDCFIRSHVLILVFRHNRNFLSIDDENVPL